MKYLQRYLSLLVALALSVALFSIPAHAEEYRDFIFDTNIQFVEDGTYVVDDWLTKQPGTLVQEVSYQTWNLNSVNDIVYTRIFAYKDGNAIISSADDKVEVTVTGFSIKSPYSIIQSDGTSIAGTKIWSTPTVAVFVMHSDGTETQINSSVIDLGYSSGSQKLTLKFSYSSSKDVTKIRTVLYMRPFEKYGLAGAATFGVKLEGSPIVFVTKIEDEEVGLLQGIWNGITDGFKDIGKKLTSGFESVTNGLTNVVKSITDLPGKIWDFFEKGLKSLLVPSDEEMILYKDKWDELLSSRLGAVYQVTDILHNSWDEVMSADEINTISIPSATINLPDNATFTFGGYEVEIVPNGFDFLVTSIKIIVGIVCSIAFINGMRKRYDEVMGVEQ